jgi:hypothetical protein
MSVRIALQCSESDSRLILADDNPAARLLSRPGEGIYNSENGLVEKNSSFQVAWLPDEERKLYLEQLSKLAQIRNYTPPQPPIIFEGNAPADITKNQALYELLSAPNWTALERHAPQAWLGEPIAIKPHLSASFRNQSRSNLLIIGQNEELAFNMLTSALLSLCAQYTPEQARFIVVNLPKSDEPWSETLSLLAEVMPHDIKIIKRNKLPAILAELAQSVADRTEAENYAGQRIYLIMAGLRRIVPDLRGNRQPSEMAQHLLSIWRGGPEVGIHNLVWTDVDSSLKEVTQSLPNVAIREFDLRVALQMSAEESSHLIDGTRASQLGPNRAYFYDEEQIDKLQKFRPYSALPEDDLRALGKQLCVRHSKQPKKE